MVKCSVRVCLCVSIRKFQFFVTQKNKCTNFFAPKDKCPETLEVKHQALISKKKTRQKLISATLDYILLQLKQNLYHPHGVVDMDNALVVHAGNGATLDLTIFYHFWPGFYCFRLFLLFYCF